MRCQPTQISRMLIVYPGDAPELTGSGTIVPAAPCPSVGPSVIKAFRACYGKVSRCTVIVPGRH